MKILIFSALALICSVQVSYAWGTCDGSPGGCLMCTNGGECVPTRYGDYRCKCPKNVIGSKCDINILRRGWIDGLNGYQYLNSTTARNYEDAQKYCKKYNAALAIHGPRNPKWVSGFVNYLSVGSEFWIGLNDKVTQGTLVWMDNILYTDVYQNNLNNQSINTPATDCGIITRTTGIFNTVRNCTSLKNYFCEKRIGYPAQVPRFDAKNNYSYSIITPAKYETSQRLCRYQGGKLAVKALGNEVIIKKILQYFSDSQCISNLDVFVGYTDKAQEGAFVAYDGRNLSTPLLWRFGNPGPDAATEDCLTVSPNYWAWLDDKYCNLLLPGLCEIPNSVRGLNEKQCKSGKVCPDNAMCLVNEVSCLEECCCLDGYIETSEGNCTRDYCGNGHIRCGDNAFCTVINDITNEQGCVCKKGFISFPDITVQGCFDPCDNVECGENARCVVDPVTAVQKCICNAGFLPNNTAEEGCFYDRCSGGNITCGDNAKCCILCDVTKYQGCICSDGYVPNPTPAAGCVEPCENINCGANARCVSEPSSTVGHCECNDGFLPNDTAQAGCFYDLCGNGNITCGYAAKCCVLCEVNKTQGCSCLPGFLANDTAKEGCFYDRCANGNITCGANARCCILDEDTKAQGCTCQDGYVANPTPYAGCVEPCDGVDCGDNARCVAEPGAVKGHCECFDGFLPNNTAKEGCFYDRCGNQNITCGIAAKCILLCNATKLQGCTCLTGFLPNNTAAEGCFFDLCGTGNITCGEKARCCILDEKTKAQGCTCIDNYVPNPNPESGCVDPCENITCGKYARCVAEPENVVGHCECNAGFLPNNTAVEGCFYDLCGNGNITCGYAAECDVLCEETKFQGCSCLPGFFPNNTAQEGCVYDLCRSGNITCGNGARCCVLCDETKLQGCTCLPGYLPNTTAEEGCFLDQCGNGNITCGDKARCCILDGKTKAQGCTCFDNYVPNPNPESGCVDPCENITCGEYARCVTDPGEVVGHCDCNAGFLPNNTAAEGCFYDLCGNGNITCGKGAQCDVLCSVTKFQGCSCLPGFLPNNTAEEGCFYDECASGNITCGSGARCCVLCDKTKFQGCTCLTGFLANDTADEGCVPDRCFNDNITCGSYARCSVLDVATKEQGCTCLAGFLPNPDPETGCINPCAGVSCGENARCVIDRISVTGRCECDAGFLPNNTAKDGCFYDLCGNGNITCGDFARCGVLCDNTNLQGCFCLPGYLPNNTAQEGCFFDLCANGNITCGNGARCCVLCDKTKLQGCSCLSGFFPNNTAEEGCLYDQCTTLNITCPANGRCALLNQDSKEQGCVCLNGYTPTPTADVACTVSDCTTLSALDIHFAEVTVSGTYETQISDPIFTGIARSTAGFSQFASFGSTIFSALSGTQDNAQLAGIPTNTAMATYLGTLHDALTRTDRNYVLIISGVVGWTPANIVAGLSDVLVIAIDGTATEPAFVQTAIEQAVSGICAWVQGGFTASTNVYVSM